MHSVCGRLKVYVCTAMVSRYIYFRSKERGWVECRVVCRAGLDIGEGGKHAIVHTMCM